MTLLDMHRSQLQHERDAGAKDRKAIADASAKTVAKERELSRNPRASRQRSLRSDLVRLGTTRAAAEKSLAAHEKKVADLSRKIATEEAAAQKKIAAAQSSQQKAIESSVSSATSAVRRLEGRVSGIEATFLAQVQMDVQKDPVARDHDVFLSHTSDARDIEVSTELYAELTGRGLDVWYDGAELHLGESLMRQIDRGIARSKIGVILITDAFLKNRVWPERELAALVSSGRRVIPVLDGVTYADLAAYSPLLADRVGLDTGSFGLGVIADQIAATLAPESVDVMPGLNTSERGERL